MRSLLQTSVQMTSDGHNFTSTVSSLGSEAETESHVTLVVVRKETCGLGEGIFIEGGLRGGASILMTCGINCSQALATASGGGGVHSAAFVEPTGSKNIFFPLFFGGQKKELIYN